MNAKQRRLLATMEAKAKVDERSPLRNLGGSPSARSGPRRKDLKSWAKAEEPRASDTSGVVLHRETALGIQSSEAEAGLAKGQHGGAQKSLRSVLAEVLLDGDQVL